MNAQSQAQRAYSAASAPTRTSKSLEYEAVARITHRLTEAQNLGSSGFSALVQALHDNKRLWNIFAVDVSAPENQLPGELKARLLYLAQFTHLHTSKVLSREATIEPLVEVNTAIMRGLRGEVA